MTKSSQPNMIFQESVTRFFDAMGLRNNELMKSELGKVRSFATTPDERAQASILEADFAQFEERHDDAEKYLADAVMLRPESAIYRIRYAFHLIHWSNNLAESRQQLQKGLTIADRGQFDSESQQRWKKQAMIELVRVNFLLDSKQQLLESLSNCVPFLDEDSFRQDIAELISDLKSDHPTKIELLNLMESTLVKS